MMRGAVRGGVVARAALVGAAAACITCGGCGSYALRGRAIEGDFPSIVVVDKDDPRLEGKGLAGVSLRVQTDPGRLNRRVVGTAVTDGSGDFAIPIDEPGAGFLEYDVGARARRKGYQSCESFFRLPGGGKRLLVTMSRGSPGDLGEDEEDLWEEFERYDR